MAGKRKTEVLVIGAGPVGLFAALCLAERGIRVQIVDKYHRSASHSYGLALHPQTLRLLDELGLARELIDCGHLVDRIALRQGDARLAELDLSALEGPFPHVLVLSQKVFEAALESRLEDKGVEVLWHHTALSFEAEAKGVSALVARTREVPADGSATEPVEITMLRMRASFLVGADGGDSLVRRLLDVEHGSRGRPMTYGLIEFQTPMESPNRMDLVFHGGSTDVLWPIGPDGGRWGLRLDDLETSGDVGRMQALIRARAPWFDADFADVDWVTAVSFENRLARRFGRERVWLAGDAAHVTSPVGVQSMNLGLQEVDDLARRISVVLNDGDSLDLLDGYDADWRRKWRRLHGISGGFRALPGAPPWAQGLAGQLLSALPASGDDLNRLLEQVGLQWSGPGRRAAGERPRAGSAPPRGRETH